MILSKERSPRNKTIDVSAAEGYRLLGRCVRLSRPAEMSEVLDRTIVGDTFEAMDMLPGGFADLLIADPPYNIRKDFHGVSFMTMTDDDYRAYSASWMERAARLLKPTASIYVCCDWRGSLIIGDLLARRFKVRNRISWQREKGRGARRNWKNGMEDIWFATVSDKFAFNLRDVKIRRRVVAPYKANGSPKGWEMTDSGNYRDTCPSNFWDDISIPYWSMSENTAHPAQKPEKLFAKLILASSNPGDVVFDPFLGSGTSSVAAYKLGRHYVGVERNETYCAWAERRLEMARDDKRIQGYIDGVFWERNTSAQQKAAGGARGRHDI
ncbi:MAG: site-specific DNA-methyltransferase [Synergistaceae bacterium]|jgi:site-specific DNA-methyltransferase (adenine-specific)|nr:site-specific DNA-methyltransferase [Synergistaceae bacterium]